LVQVVSVELLELPLEEQMALIQHFQQLHQQAAVVVVAPVH
jgi:hypothetical protein